MDFLNNLENNSILLIPNDIKDKVLDYINDNKLLLNIKIMTFRDLKVGILYDYSNEAIYHVMNTYDLNYDIAKSYINYTYYITEESYANDKLNNILTIKKDLENNNLLIKDSLFINLLKSKKNLYVYGFDYINKFYNKLLDIASNYIKVISLEKNINDYIHEVIEFKNIENEVFYVAEEISKLINKDIPLNKIYITNYSNDYYFTIHRIFKQFNIPIYIKGETHLYDTHIGRYFIDNLSNNMEKLLYKIRKKFDIDNNENNNIIYTKLFNLINTYSWTTDYISIKDLIIEEMKSRSIPSKHYNEEIVTTSITDNIFSDDEYVFMLGFNLGSAPKIIKDEDYINDDIKTDLMETSIQLNKINKDVLTKAIKNIKNITITYKLNTSSEKVFGSSLINGNNLIKKIGDNSYSTFSEEYNKYLLANKIDNLIKFNEIDNTLSVLNNNYDIPYSTYNNQLDIIDKNKITPILENGNFSFSYSNISTYYKCPFEFYMNNFFKLDKYKSTFDTFIGSLFHKVLEDCINSDKDIDNTYDEFIKEHENDLELTLGNRYFIEKLREDIHMIVENINKQYKYSKHTNENHEGKIKLETKDIDLNTNIKTILKGFVDKLLIINGELLVIDYKTGNSDVIDPKLFEFGLNIQLPIYLYLLKNDEDHKNDQVVGMYLQHILSGFVNYKDLGNKSYEEYAFDNLKLDGITLDDESKIQYFDNSYESSNIIKGLSKKADGNWNTRSGKKIFTYDDLDNLYTTIKELIENCINDVADSKFPIKPINIYNSVDACQYCKYKDICFKKKSDINYVSITSKTEGDDSNE